VRGPQRGLVRSPPNRALTRTRILGRRPRSSYYPPLVGDLLTDTGCSPSVVKIYLRALSPYGADTLATARWGTPVAARLGGFRLRGRASSKRERQQGEGDRIGITAKDAGLPQAG